MLASLIALSCFSISIKAIGTPNITATQADAQKPGPEAGLQAFNHNYDLKIKAFITLNGELSRTLVSVDAKNNKWQFVIAAKASFGLNSKMVSDFVFDDQQIHSIKLSEKKPGSDEIKTVRFAMLDQPLWDKANIQIQLQQDLIRGLDISQKPYKIQDKTYSFRIVRKEKLKVPAGEFDTVLVETLLPDNKQDEERLFWFAPKQNYILVKYYQKNRGGTYDATLAD